MNVGATLIMLTGLAIGGGQPELSVGSAPPVVTKTVPESGATGIDHSASEIRVTFSKTMKPGAWSWNKASESTFPKLAGEPRYEKDGRTCVLPVSLLPGKTYAIWINSSAGGRFQDEAGRPAVPYLLVFATRKGTAAIEIEQTPPRKEPSDMALQRSNWRAGQ